MHWCFVLLFLSVVFSVLLHTPVLPICAVDDEDPKLFTFIGMRCERSDKSGKMEPTECGFVNVTCNLFVLSWLLMYLIYYLFY